MNDIKGGKEGVEKVFDIKHMVVTAMVADKGTHTCARTCSRSPSLDHGTNNQA